MDNKTVFFSSFALQEEHYKAPQFGGVSGFIGVPRDFLLIYGNISLIGVLGVPKIGGEWSQGSE